MKPAHISASRHSSRILQGLRLALAGIGATLLLACVQLPTETQGAVDMRPRIGFNVAAGVDTSGARVLVDGLDAGTPAEFRPPAGKLVVAGTHEIEVIQGRRILLKERIFLAAGAQRDLLVAPRGQP